MIFWIYNDHIKENNMMAYRCGMKAWYYNNPYKKENRGNNIIKERFSSTNFSFSFVNYYFLYMYVFINKVQVISLFYPPHYLLSSVNFMGRRTFSLCFETFLVFTVFG